LFIIFFLGFRLSNDYCRLICRSLIKNKLIKFLEGQYKITDLGKKELEKLGIIEKVPKDPDKSGPIGQVKKVIIPKKKARAKIKPKKKIINKAKKAKKKTEAKKSSIAELSDFGVKLIKILKKKGFRNLEDIATTSVSRLMQMVEGLGLKKSAQLINKARAKLRKEGKEYLWE
ncbi:hypothetical protein L6250_01720, partial [Candidatus Parcubacteria bacterium]|nr:hypothetical protein [Candidatus Parcubacteria bacterium]